MSQHEAKHLREALRLAQGLLRLDTCSTCGRFATWFQVSWHDEGDSHWCEDHCPDKTTLFMTLEEACRRMGGPRRFNHANDILAYEKVLEQLKTLDSCPAESHWTDQCKHDEQGEDT